jgi:hypothetical protein
VLHNQVVRQAAYDHVGSVLLQEGDSFLLAFHEPQDAVEFALQVATSGPPHGLVLSKRLCMVRL